MATSPDGSKTSVAYDARGPITNHALLAAVALIVATLYWPTMIELVRVWSVDPNYSHGFLVPLASLIIAVMAWRKSGSPLRDQLDTTQTWWGAVQIGAGLALHYAAWFVGILLIDVVALLLILRGLAAVMGGRQATRAYGFAILFLIFMAPLPAAWYQPLARSMQQSVSSISLVFLEGVGIPAFREGYFIHLPGYTMEVGEACSGLRQLTAVLTLAVAVGYFSGRGPVYRWTLALVALPIAVAANCVRVMLTGVIMIFFGPKWAEGVYHTLEGLVIVALAAGLVLLTAWAMAQLGPSRDDSTGDPPDRVAGAET